jgi:hypothetical protein
MQYKGTQGCLQGCLHPVILRYLHNNVQKRSRYLTSTIRIRRRALEGHRNTLFEEARITAWGCAVQQSLASGSADRCVVPGLERAQQMCRSMVLSIHVGGAIGGGRATEEHTVHTHSPTLLPLCHLGSGSLRTLVLFSNHRLCALAQQKSRPSLAIGGFWPEEACSAFPRRCWNGQPRVGCER